MIEALCCKTAERLCCGPFRAHSSTFHKQVINTSSHDVQKRTGTTNPLFINKLIPLNSNFCFSVDKVINIEASV